MSQDKSVDTRAKPRQRGGIDGMARSGVEDTQIVGGLARGLSILSAFRRTDKSLGNSEMAERTGLNKATASRMAYTLALKQFLTFNPETREYSLGPQVIALGAIALAATDVRTLALPFLNELAEQSNINVGLGTRQGLRMIYTDTAEGRGLVGLRLYAGSLMPIATSAMGKAYMAALDEEKREKLMRRLAETYPDQQEAIRSKIVAAVAEFEKRGYCSSIGDWQPDIHGVAVPIKAPLGSPVYVMNLGGPSYLLPEAEIHEKHAPKLLAAVRQLEAALGNEVED